MEKGKKRGCGQFYFRFIYFPQPPLWRRPILIASALHYSWEKRLRRNRSARIAGKRGNGGSWINGEMRCMEIYGIPGIRGREQALLLAGARTKTSALLVDLQIQTQWLIPNEKYGMSYCHWLARWPMMGRDTGSVAALRRPAAPWCTCGLVGLRTHTYIHKPIQAHIQLSGYR